MLTGIILASSITSCFPLLPPPPQAYQQRMRNYEHYDDRTRERETPLERERREYQERHPEIHHCRLPACSTR